MLDQSIETSENAELATAAIEDLPGLSVFLDRIAMALVEWSVAVNT